jgi:2-methylisocitrate lyase-like PEP mutase family enzyme
MLFNRFKSLHAQTAPLLIANVWDVPSATIAQKNGFKAIGTSSAAMASTLGFSDGENIPFSDILFMVEKINSAVSIPISVDIEAGYSEDPDITCDHIKSLVKLGVSGINIEDSKVIDSKRSLIDATKFTSFLSAIKNNLNKNNIQVFINVRTDTYLLGIHNALDETKKRITQYQNVGADGIFLPCITNDNDIRECVRHTPLPINVMCMPDLSSFNELAKLGVSRISMGNFVHQQQLEQLANSLKDIKRTGSFDILF